LENFYEKYKKIRKDQKIDLKNIENRTKINIKYLEAIENGQFEIFHKPYLRLFLKAYVTEIGADPNKALDELDEHLLRNSGKRIKKININKTESSKQSEQDKQATKNIDNVKAVSSNKKQKTIAKRSNFGANLFRAILFIAISALIIFMIRNVALNNQTEKIENSPANKVIEAPVIFTLFDQLHTDFIEDNVHQLVIEQEIPLSVKISSNQSLGIVSVIDSVDTTAIPISAGDQYDFNFNTNLELILNHSYGVTATINGDSINTIKPQQSPVYLQFSIDPKSLTVRHYSETD